MAGTATAKKYSLLLLRVTGYITLFFLIFYTRLFYYPQVFGDPIPYFSMTMTVSLFVVAEYLLYKKHKLAFFILLLERVVIAIRMGGVGIITWERYNFNQTGEDPLYLKNIFDLIPYYSHEMFLSGTLQAFVKSFRNDYYYLFEKALLITCLHVVAYIYITNTYKFVKTAKAIRSYLIAIVLSCAFLTVIMPKGIEYVIFETTVSFENLFLAVYSFTPAMFFTFVCFKKNYQQSNTMMNHRELFLCVIYLIHMGMALTDRLGTELLGNYSVLYLVNLLIASIVLFSNKRTLDTLLKNTVYKYGVIAFCVLFYFILGQSGTQQYFNFATGFMQKQCLIYAVAWTVILVVCHKYYTKARFKRFKV